jgi:hypothetical protein
MIFKYETTKKEYPMRKAVIIGLAIVLTIPVFGRSIQSNKQADKTPPTKLPRLVEPALINTHGGNNLHGPITHHVNRDSEFSSVLIDSSLNGYGAYNPTPNPLAYALDEGYIAVYRQYQGSYEDGFTAGYIGASQSEDGEEWFSEQTLNTSYPTGEEEPNLPTATGTPQGRYPSAGFALDGAPTAIWNEYTNGGQGGGQYGGYPLYAYDSEGIGEFSTWSNTYHLNNGCGTLPCDPPDLWNGNATVNGGDGSPILTGIYSGWSDSPSAYYWISSSYHYDGYFIMNDPYVIASDGDVDDNDDPLWYDGGGYTSSPDYHINEEGIGYMGLISYTYMSDTESPKLHTFFYKHTDNHGETWSSDEGFNNTGYNYISDEVMINLSDSLYTMWSENTEDYPDQLWYPWAECDSLDDSGNTITYTCGDSMWFSNVEGPSFLTPGWFFFYDFDMRTDKDGGLHMVTIAIPSVCPDEIGGCDDLDDDGLADTLYNWYWNSAGHYYFYNPDPVDNPDNWTATFLNDFNDTYNADWADSDIPFINSTAGYGPWYYFYPQITLSAEDDSEVMWYASAEGSEFAYNSDSSLYLPGDIDIYMAKSTNLGKDWSELENVTNTPGGIFPDKSLEVGVHLANVANDDEVAVFFQMPDFYNESLPPALGYEDYQNRVYVGLYGNDYEFVGNDGEMGVTPEAFTLSQNFPNPFNPITHIKYDVNMAGLVTMDLFDIRGSKVKSLINESKTVGSHEFAFDGSSISSGVYFYSMTVNGVTQTRKLVLMK